MEEGVVADLLFGVLVPEGDVAELGRPGDGGGAGGGFGLAQQAQDLERVFELQKEFGVLFGGAGEEVEDAGEGGHTAEGEQGHAALHEVDVGLGKAERDLDYAEDGVADLFWSVEQEFS